MKPLIAMLAIFVAVAASIPAAISNESEAKSVHDFKVKDINGKEVKLDAYKGKVLLVMNVASKCGYTKQYTDMQALHKEYKDKGLVVMGFPANNYGQQEPGTDAEIKEFCTTKFNVTFPMFSKVSVLGEDQAPLFKYLTSLENPDFKGDIKWNFEKFLIGKDGKLLHRFRSKDTPTGEAIKKAVEAALKS